MAILLRDKELDEMIRQLSGELGTSLQGAVKIAVKAELRRRHGQTLQHRVKPILDKLEALPRRDDYDPDHKAFFDRESGGV